MARKRRTKKLASNNAAGGGCASLLMGVGILIALPFTLCFPSERPKSDEPVAANIALSVSPTASSPKHQVSPSQDEYEVSVSKVTLRASPGGKNVGSLKGGSAVSVVARSGTWARVSPDGESPKWLKYEQLCKGKGCFSAKAQKSKAKQASRKRSTTTEVSSAGTSSSAESTFPADFDLSKTDGSDDHGISSAHSRTVKQRVPDIYEGCPCSSSQVCIGPRGGVYCITSGGNKRYFPRH